MAKYGKAAAKTVESVMHRQKKGTLKSGSGRKVTSRKQAIAIALSEAREKGAKVPPPPAGRKGARKTGAAKGALKGARKAARKTAGTAKRTRTRKTAAVASRKTAARKATPRSSAARKSSRGTRKG
jgi:hypothetical protein